MTFLKKHIAVNELKVDLDNIHTDKVLRSSITALNNTIQPVSVQ